MRYKVGDRFYLCDDEEPKCTMVEIVKLTKTTVWYKYVHCGNSYYENLLKQGPFSRSRFHFKIITEKVISATEIWKKLNESP